RGRDSRRWPKRPILLLIVAFGLAPGTWLRSSPPPPDSQQVLQTIPLARPGRSVGSLRLAGVWELRSPNDDFHGYSALALVEGSLLALSDRGRILRFSPPDMPAGPVLLGPFSSTEQGDDK